MEAAKSRQCPYPILHSLGTAFVCPDAGTVAGLARRAIGIVVVVVVVVEVVVVVVLIVIVVVVVVSKT